MKFIGPLFLIVGLFAAIKAGAQTRKDRLVLAIKPASFELIWTYKDLPFKFRVFEAPERTMSSLYKMDNIAQLKDIPVGRELTGKTVDVRHRGATMLYLVAENTGTEAIHFSAAPHHVDPVADSLGFNFKCLCFGHVYTAEPKKFWYRIVKLEAKGSQSGKKVRIEHAVFRVPKKP